MEAIVHLIYFTLINSLRIASLARLRSYVVRTTLEKFETGGLTLETHQMFSVYITPGEFKNAKVSGHFGFVFKENSVREIT